MRRKLTEFTKPRVTQRMMYCDVCPELTCTEQQQDELKSTGKNSDHRCKKYNTKLYHDGHHPNICKCSECLKQLNTMDSSDTSNLPRDDSYQPN